MEINKMVNKNHIYEAIASVTIKYLSLRERLEHETLLEFIRRFIAQIIFGREPFCLELISTELDYRMDPAIEKQPLKAHEYRYDVGGEEDNEHLIIEAKFKVPDDFGKIGAIWVKNQDTLEMFLESIVLSGLPDGEVRFSCKSWVHSQYVNPDKRIFFANKSYLPSQTPEGLVRRRKAELEILRGNGEGERQNFERIYDYDFYNDLGAPDADVQLRRPVLGGTQNCPYPRRCRTGRPKSKIDSLSEMRYGSFYVPRDEEFASVKEWDFSMNNLRAVLHILIGLIPNMVDANLDFLSFNSINALFSEAIHLPRPTDQWNIITNIEENLFFKPPELLERDMFSWLRDEEFARQTLSGTNPCNIKLVKEWPLMSKLDNAKDFGPPESAITDKHIQPGIVGTVEQAIALKKLFMLDYHDVLMPYVNKVREIPRTTLYASRTIFYLTPLGILKPLAIELARPGIGDKPHWKGVYTPILDGTGSWLWRLAKAHVLSHDSAHHQLISHWLRAHCCTEPYIIAANRHLSAMHPIHRLLLPYFRYTMEMNALARGVLINANGIIESVFALGKYSMELSSSVYRDEWRFDLQGLPADLISRGMAEENRFAQHGLNLAIKDYPYANDGLLLWDAIKEWVTDYVNIYYSQDAGLWQLTISKYYNKGRRGLKTLFGLGNEEIPPTPKLDMTKEDNLVRSDEELQTWWREIQEVGHGDKNGKPGWPKLETKQDLIGILTNIIWVSSGHHAAVNFGQYTYSSYFPNRPTIARTKMPDDDRDEDEWRRFIERPETTLLESFPSRIQATKIMAILEVLSSHSPDEEYIGGRLEAPWEEDVNIIEAFTRFQKKLTEMERVIDEKNGNEMLKNRVGTGIVPYQLLKPSSGPGVTGMGVPNSISI